MTTDSNNDLNLLLVPDDDRTPTLGAGLPSDAASSQVTPTTVESSFADFGASPNDLYAQLWGVVAPAGPEGDALLARIKPLIDARRDEIETPPPVFRVPPTMSLDEATKWRAEVLYGKEIEDVPRYLLLLGDLHEVPLSLERAIHHETLCGRLAFSHPNGYEAYVEKLLRAERSEPNAHRKAVFYTVHDRTAATKLGYDHLITPVAEQARAGQARGRFAADEVLQLGNTHDPSPSEFLDVAGESQSAAVLTMSHGAGAPRRGWRTVADQQAHQGALCFGNEGKLYADDITDQAFMPGCLWLMLACFGAGTPKQSTFYHWLTALQDEGRFRGHVGQVLESLPSTSQRPFIAALPQAALANPNGPLAIIGHLDLAWTYSFLELDSGARKQRTEKFTNLLKQAMHGDRFGVVMHALTRAFVAKNVELNQRYDRAEAAKVHGDPERVERARLSHLWMARQDLLGYTLLGDPAARLHFTKRSRRRKKG
ncbi:MAG: hypothetical protein ACPG77_00730 [Nannocystaceae bacterium]